MHLVIVESPAKAKTIEKYLGSDYKVLASKGHIVDLPKSQLGIDLENNYTPDYVVSNKKSLDALKKAYKLADSIVLAVDSDREGEAIGWHIARELKLLKTSGKKNLKSKPYSRITFTEITKEAIKDAITKKHEIDFNLVDAQQARRVLDRIVGYKLSPLLWQKIRYGLSAGRVQSVALRLIVDREKERMEFKPEEYWNMTAMLSEKILKQEPLIKITLKIEGEEGTISDPDIYQEDTIPFKLAKINNTAILPKGQKEIEALMKRLVGEKWVIQDIKKQTSYRKPKAPFITSTLQQTAANLFGYSAKQTMKLAQDLYEGGHITYMRTDSLNISNQAMGQIRTQIADAFGRDFLSEKERYYVNKSKSSQEAHEAIRPTNMAFDTEDLKSTDKHKKLYRLIWQRTMASQMVDAEVESIKVIIIVNDCLFQVIGQRLVREGYLKVYFEKFTEVTLPDLKIGQTLYLHRLLSEQKFTEPPARYSEASLIKALESYGIGRPSTYAPIISTIMNRNYVEKEGKSLTPTDTGMVVVELLKKHFKNIVDLNFTAEIESRLDQIALGKERWVKVIDDFYKPFSKNLEEKKVKIKREDYTVLGKSEEKCPECGKEMIIKLGRFGKFYSCSNFPECKGMKSFEADPLENMDLKSGEFLSKYLPSPLTDDKRDYLLKRGRYGYFWAHPDYPKVKDARPLELTKEMFKNIYGNPPRSKDGKKMILRKGRFGEFWAHPKYPLKKEVIRMDQKQIKEKKIEFDIL